MKPGTGADAADRHPTSNATTHREELDRLYKSRARCRLEVCAPKLINPHKKRGRAKIATGIRSAASKRRSRTRPRGPVEVPIEPHASSPRCLRELGRAGQQKPPPFRPEIAPGLRYNVHLEHSSYRPGECQYRERVCSHASRIASGRGRVDLGPYSRSHKVHVARTRARHQFLPPSACSRPARTAPGEPTAACAIHVWIQAEERHRMRQLPSPWRLRTTARAARAGHHLVARRRRRALPEAPHGPGR